MAEENETIEDIVGDIRAQNQGLPEDATALSPLVCDILNLADRLEAARKREVGDCAKLREALKLYDRIIQDRTLICDCDIVYGARTLASAALAAPPRNCDKYATADEALKAQEQMFNDSNFANGECKLGCPECDNPRVGCKIAWLFAPATEKEGGAK